MKSTVLLDISMV